MSRLPKRWNRSRLTVLGAVIALAGGGMAAANLAGAASGPSALDYAQCQNGAPGTTPNPDCTWINGILNASGSQYHEDQVTPQRLLVSFPDTGSGTHLHSVTLKYLDRKGAIHAYDYLAAADATMTDALSLRCNGLAANICPGGTASTVVSTPDNDHLGPVSGGYSDVIGSHMAGLTTAQKTISLFGATFSDGLGSNPPAMSDPTHDCLSPCTGDDYATVTFSFFTSGTGTHNVQLLFGGHLAAASQLDGWGTGLGASSVSGGPYHIKWAAADGSSVGNRDNQIMSNAIIPIIPQGSTLTTTPSTTSEDVGSTNLSAVTDTAELTPDSGHAPTGSMTFTLYGPLTAPDYNDCTDPVGGVGGNVVAGPDGSHSLTLESGTTNTYSATSNEVDMTGFAPGVYQWVADYVAGTDQYNLDVDGTCGDSTETVTINKIDATGASTQTITDTVTVTGDSPTGHVNWYAYDTSDCSNTPVFSDEWVGDSDTGSQNNILDGSSQATSEPFTPDPADGGTTYYWQVTYSGDDNNNGGTIETCGDQQVIVQNAPVAGP